MIARSFARKLLGLSIAKPTTRARIEPILPSREQPPDSTWIRPSAAVAAGLRYRILDLENQLRQERRQVIVAEFAAKIDKTQIKQLLALLARQQNTNPEEAG